MVARLRDQYARGRAIVSEVLGRCPRIELTEPRGAFYVFPRVRGMRSSLAFAQGVLEEEDVGIAPGYTFGPGNEEALPAVLRAVARAPARRARTDRPVRRAPTTTNSNRAEGKRRKGCHDNRRTAERARHRASSGASAGGELRARGAHRKPALSGGQGSGRATGKVGGGISVEEAYGHARETGLILIAVMRQELGSLDRVNRIVKVLGMVNAVPEFGQQPQVINGCSDLFVEIFGEKGRHARSAVGMGSLPGGIPVEIEAIRRSRRELTGAVRDEPRPGVVSTAPGRRTRSGPDDGGIAPGPDHRVSDAGPSDRLGCRDRCRTGAGYRLHWLIPMPVTMEKSAVTSAIHLAGRGPSRGFRAELPLRQPAAASSRNRAIRAVTARRLLGVQPMTGRRDGGDGRGGEEGADMRLVVRRQVIGLLGGASALPLSPSARSPLAGRCHRRTTSRGAARRGP